MHDNKMRIVTAVTGAIAGLSLWLMVEVLPDLLENKWFYLWISSLSCGFFTVLLGLLGPLGLRKAALVAVGLGLTAASLFFWASLRFTDFENAFESGLNPAAFAVLLFIGAPFGAALTQKRVWDYAYLFDTAWGIVVRYVAAMVFVGVFWGVLFLSHALLEIVGITVIWDVIELDGVSFILTGLVLGLALAVANELRAYVSPYLVLRLLRLLMPPLLLVVIVFLIAVPIQGLSGLFGGISAAATLMSVAITGAYLIAAALDRADEDAVKSQLMRLVTKGFAGILSVLAGLAVWAVLIRVSDYGWTPERLAAFVSSLFVLAYGLLYAYALLSRDWMARIRQANIYHALAVVLVAALWMTPLLDATRIAAKSQTARFVAGKSTLEQLPAWELANEWGNAGQAALAELKALEGDRYAGLSDLLARAERQSRWEFGQTRNLDQRKAHLERAFAQATFFPDARVAALEQWLELSEFELKRIADGCADNGCVFITADETPETPGVTVIFRQDGDARFIGDVYRIEADDLYHQERLADIDRTTFDALKSGDFKVAPSSQKSIWVGNAEIQSRAFGDRFSVGATN